MSIAVLQEPIVAPEVDSVKLRQSWWAAASSWRGIAFRDRWIMIILGLLLVLNRGFSSMPISELTLVIYLISINWRVFLPRLLRGIPLWPYAAWWGIGIGSAVLASFEYGFWAFRDAGFILDSLFLLVGYAFARSEFQIYALFRWLRVIFFIGCCYALTFPFAKFLEKLAQTPGTHGQGNAILGQYLTVGSVVMLAAVSAYTIAPRRTIFRQFSPLFFSMIIALVAIEFQSRGFYLLIIAVGVLLGATYPQQAWRFWFAPFLFVFAVALIQVSGIELHGRLGKISLDFLLEHFASLSGKASGLAAEGAADGVLQRYAWWHSVLTRWLSSSHNFLFGLGYGLPLIDFVDPSGNPVRDPHNSYLTILGRSGFIGAASWIWINVHLIFRWQRAYFFTRRTGDLLMQGNLLICMVFFLSCWLGAIGEPVFEYPFNTIIYYFLAGVCLRYATFTDKNSTVIPL